MEGVGGVMFNHKSDDDDHNSRVPYVCSIHPSICLCGGVVVVYAKSKTETINGEGQQSGLNHNKYSIWPVIPFPFCFCPEFGRHFVAESFDVVSYYSSSP